MSDNTIQGYHLSPQQRELWRRQLDASDPVWVQCVIRTPRPLRPESAKGSRGFTRRKV